MADRAKVTGGCAVLLLAPILFCGFAGWLIQPSEADLQKQAAETAAAEAQLAAKDKHEKHLRDLEQSKREARQIVEDTEQWEKNRESLAKFQDRVKNAPLITASTVQDSGKLVVQVDNLWHYEHKQIRLQAAQAIGVAWQQCGASGDFSLVDVNGNEVGGRGITGVWVAE